MQVKLSVCIPLFNSEETLCRCLESVLAQDFTDWELLLVNDGSSGLDQGGRNCKEIVKDFRKEHKLSKKQFKYIEHSSNLGPLEARRTLVEAANSDYIVMLDSDDVLLPGALSFLYENALTTGSDIVHSGIDLFYTDEKAREIEKRIYAKANNIFEGQLSGHDIFNNFLIKKGHVGFLCGKIIKRELFLQAFSYIPFTQCVMGYDFLIYFFVSYFAKSYYGIKKNFYRYSIDTGISSTKQITSLKRWEHIASSANIFTIIFSVLKEYPDDFNLSLDDMEALRYTGRSYLANNISQLKTVIPELQSKAREILCDYWGEDFVEMMEKAMDKAEV